MIPISPGNSGTLSGTRTGCATGLFKSCPGSGLMHMHWRVHQFFIFRLIKFFRRYDSTWFWKLPAPLHWSTVFTPGLVILIRVMFVRFQPIEVNNQFLSRSIYISYSLHNIFQCLHNDVWAFPGVMELRRSTSWYG